ncbi:protein XRI1 [Cryptomeria japonica]|uniref:protein XRI1 n=1 Tax=Cryptomeria japonica TaxID=3369 RepID=UPI0027D9F689|nr:protein XRI1 [Cryptomeria japonica]
MSFNESWQWQGEEFQLDGDSPLAISHTLWGNLNEEESRNLFESTPAKDCMESKLAPTSVDKQGNGEESSLLLGMQEDVDSPRSKRRRMLQFSDPTMCNEDNGHRLETFEGCRNSTMDGCVDVHSPELNSQGLLCKEDPYSSVSESMKQESTSWVDNCLNDGELQLMSDELEGAVDFDDQIDISEFCQLQASESEFEIQHTAPSQAILPGKKIRHHTPTRLVTPVAYPFTLVKPCGVQGDVTLNDINQRILMPNSGVQHGSDCDGLASQPVSSLPYSGKAVVSLTKIHTEGNGSITIMRTKG